MRMLAAGTFAAMVVATPAHAAAPSAGDLVVNGSFDSGTKGWWSSKNTPIKVDGGRLCAEVPAGGEKSWSAQLGQSRVAFEAGQSYKVSFEATATKTARIRSVIQRGSEPYTAVVDGWPEVGPASKKFSFVGRPKAGDPEGQLLFQVGGAAEAYTLCLDNVSVVPVVEHVVNGSFDAGTKGWWSSKNTPIKVDGGRLCAEVPAGGDKPWTSIVGQSRIPFKAGQPYRLSFKASASKNVKIRSVAQLGAEPHTGMVDGWPELGAGQRTYVYNGVAKATDAEGQVLFQVGGAAEPYTLCLDDVSFTGGE
ncbi:carbohydrate binding domain-containing protein [Nonomuraea sp. NPDC050556]|uniref:carbohydrate binding domain-containing protein n=1 Tax=Nonomuraea sp. NPDC050556 TaxID=3364369 RepID=UPI0037B56E7C